jgi:4-carboxymuconolactone decarboxylase
MAHDDPSNGDDGPGGDRRRRGRAAIAALHGAVGLGYVDRLAQVSPEMADLLLAYPYGSVYARPGLGLRDRQIATIAALATLGGAEHELSIHVRSALRVGLTRAEIVEIVLQMTVYAGFPRALAALHAVAAAFAEVDRADGAVDSDGGGV